MKISYAKGTPEEVIAAIQAKLEGRKLGEMVNFDLNGTGLDVTIKKLGTSLLSFQQIAKTQGLAWHLTKEKIALSHRPFKDEVMDKIAKIVEQTGGKMEA